MKQHLLFLSLLITVLPVGAQERKDTTTTDTLDMERVVHDLPEFVVKGERPIARVQGSTITYDLPRLIERKAADNVYEALKYLPGVTEMDEKLTLGGMAVTVILDGKVSTMTEDELTALLKSMPASKIAKVEVMYNAPARMQVRGAVINIVLRHGNADGAPLTGEAGLTYRQEHDESFEERATLLYNKKNLSVDMMYARHHGRSFSKRDEETQQTLDNGTVYDISSAQRSHSHDYGDDLRFGLDYRFANNHSLSLVYTGAYKHGKIWTMNDGNVEGSNDIRNHSWLHDLRLDYQLPIGLKLGAEMTYYATPEHQQLQGLLPTGSMNYQVEDNQRVNRWKFFLAEEQSLGKGWGINYGAVYNLSINHTSQQYVEKENTMGANPTDERTRQREDDVNLYVGGSKSFGSALSLEGSVAAEYYHSPVWSKWTVYPTFNLTWMPAAGQMLQLGLSYDRSYPSYREMTNFTTYSNGGYDEITGNPNIKPSDSYNAHLVYLVRGKYQAVLFYNYTNNYFVQSPYLRSDRLAITYQYQNFDFHRQVGIQLTAPFQIGSWWNLRPTAIGMYLQEKDDSYFTLAINRHRFVFVGLLDNTFTLSKQPDITFNILGKVQTRAIQAIYDLSGCQRLDMSLRWQFARNHAVLRLYCNDLFESSSITPTINYANQHLAMHFSTYRELGINFTYKFGNYKERRHESVDTSRF